MCCLYFTSITAVSLWLYRVSAAQDVVQQLILRLIHFLLNCPQTQDVIQPVLVNPRPCFTHTTFKKKKKRRRGRDMEQLFAHQFCSLWKSQSEAAARSQWHGGGSMCIYGLSVIGSFKSLRQELHWWKSAPCHCDLKAYEIWFGVWDRIINDSECIYSGLGRHI